MAFDLQSQKKDYRDGGVFGDVYGVAMFPKEIHGEKDPLLIPPFQVQLPDLRHAVRVSSLFLHRLIDICFALYLKLILLS